MKKINILRLVAFFVFLFSICFFIYLKTAVKTSKPNIILIVVDSLRPDHLGCYGYKRDVSSNIDNFSKTAVLFSEAISQSPETQCSVASFLTSTYPSRHFRNYQDNWIYISDSAPSLIKLLKKAGYYTGIITDAPEMSRIFDIGNFKNDFSEIKDIAFNNSAEVTNAALSFIKSRKSNKFFLYLHYFGVHYPYVPSEPYASIFERDGNNPQDRQVPIAENGSDIFDHIFKEASDNGITSLNHYICQYDGKIRIVDEQIGRLLDGLERLGLEKNVVIILTADHGEGFGEHNLYCQHSYTIFDELIRVPLLVRYPGFKNENRIINRQIGLIDIMPTILDMVGIRSNAGGMDGKSFLSLIKNKSEDTFQDRMIFGLSMSGIMYYARTELNKLVYVDFDKAFELFPTFKIPDFLYREFNVDKIPMHIEFFYDLKQDTSETNYCKDIDNPALKFFRKKLNEFVKKMESENMKAKVEAERYLSLRSVEQLDTQTRNRLKSLGYMQ